MAKLLPETTEIANILKQQALDIVDQASSLELAIFQVFGETDETIDALDEMRNTVEDATSSYTRLSNLQLQIAQAQPVASRDTLQLLEKTIARTQNRIGALVRSVQEVKIQFNIP